MVILQKIFAVFLSIFAIFFNFLVSPQRLFDSLLGSKFDEEAFVEALNAKDVPALEDMMSQRMKDKYPDLTDQLTELCRLLGETAGEPFIKGDFDEWEGLFQNTFEKIADRIGYDYVTGNYLLNGSGGMTAGGGASEVWWYQLKYGN